MKIKTFLYIFMAVVLASPSAAFALSAPVGTPASQWTIGPMNMGKSRGESYCSMKNRFSNDVVLVFARDTAGMNSIAIDFQDSLFEPGHEYMVSLDVRRSVTRSVKAMAATSQVLIMQMGYDFVFYEGVRTKNVLQVIVDRKTAVAFSLSGTAKALSALDDCVSALELAPIKNIKLQAEAAYAQQGYLDALPPPPSYMAMAGESPIEVELHTPRHGSGDQPVSNATNLELLKQLKALREEVHAMKSSRPDGKPVTQEDVAHRQAQLENEITALKQSLERTQAVLAQQAEISKAELGKAQMLIGRLEQEKQVLNQQTEVIAAKQQREEALKQTQVELQQELSTLKRELGAAQQMLEASKQEAELERARRDQRMLDRLVALEEENARLKQVVARKETAPAMPVMEEDTARIVVRPVGNKTTGDVRTAVEQSKRPSLVEMMRPVSAPPETSDPAATRMSATALHDKAVKARRVKSVAEIAKTVQPPEDGLRRLINAARLADDGSLRQVRKTRNGNVTFSWETDSLFGGASQVAWQKGRDFNDIVEGYIAAIGRQCLGKFSYNMGKARRVDNGIVTLGADASCIDDDQNPATALLFYGSEERGFFTVISHEGTTQQIKTALSKRDAAYMAMRRAF